MCSIASYGMLFNTGYIYISIANQSVTIMLRIPRTARSLELSYRSHAVHHFKTEKPLKLTCPAFKGSTSRSKKQRHIML